MNYLSRLYLDGRSRAVRRDLADCQQLHRTLLRAFPNGDAAATGARAEYSVLYRVEGSLEGGPVAVLVQSAVEPDWTKLPEGFLRPAAGELANPAYRTLDPFWDSLTAGECLRFRLRANPTKKVDTKTGPDGARRNGRRVALTQEADQVAWLERKGSDSGFVLATIQAGDRAIPNVRVISEGQQLGQREARGADRPPNPDRLTFGAVVFEGVLVVTDAAALRATLVAGIGSGKAYGFGLLSVARAAG